MSTHVTETHTRAIMYRIWFVLSYMPLAVVTLTFGVHAVMGLTGSPELREIVSVLGFGSSVTAILVFFSGVHDGAVSILVVFKDKLFPKLPWWLVFVYTATWPVVPRLLIWIAGNPFEWGEAIIFGAISLSAWVAQIARNRIGLGWS